jgi:hypothetical protein
MDTAATLSDQPLIDDEVELVLEWRLEQLERAGFRGDVVVDLAERRDVDLHDALRLVEAGCPPALAARILL